MALVLTGLPTYSLYVSGDSGTRVVTLRKGDDLGGLDLDDGQLNKLRSSTARVNGKLVAVFTEAVEENKPAAKAEVPKEAKVEVTAAKAEAEGTVKKKAAPKKKATKKKAAKKKTEDK